MVKKTRILCNKFRLICLNKGGFDGVDYFNSCRAFNAVTKEWRNIAAMHNKRCYVSVALINTNKIYAMGG